MDLEQCRGRTEALAGKQHLVPFQEQLSVAGSSERGR